MHKPTENLSLCSYDMLSVNGINEDAMLLTSVDSCYFVPAREGAPYVPLKVIVGRSLEASLARLRKKLQEEEAKRKEETSNVEGTGFFPCTDSNIIKQCVRW